MVIRNVELTPEVVERLRKYAPIRSTATFPYVPKAYRDLPEDVRPVFELRRLNGVEVLKQMDSMRGKVEFTATGGGSVAISRGQVVIDTCRRGIVGWKNYIDFQTGEEIVFDKELSALPDQLMCELCDAITEGVPLSDDEVQSLG